MSLDLTAEIAIIDSGQSVDMVVDVHPQPPMSVVTLLDDGELAWNNTPSCMRTQRHMMRHRRSQRTVTFPVNAVVSGDRVGALTGLSLSSDGEERTQGLREILSELLIKSALKGDIDLVCRLVSCQYVHVDVADRTGNTALHCASVSSTTYTVHLPQ